MNKSLQYFTAWWCDHSEAKTCVRCDLPAAFPGGSPTVLPSRQECMSGWCYTCAEHDNTDTKRPLRAQDSQPYPAVSHIQYKADSWFAASQWEMLLQSNVVSHWLDANLESVLQYLHIVWMCSLEDNNRVHHWKYTHTSHIVHLCFVAVLTL